MSVVSLKEIVDRAFRERYGVAAINVVNGLTMEAVLAAAVDLRSPVIIQTSVKTVRSIGLDLLFAMWREMTAGIEVPVCLHLDHCPDRALLSHCLRKGWNSVLFDGSRMPVAENLRQTVDVVAEARSYGAHVEGEIEAITGVEDDIGSDEEASRQSLPVALDFIRKTGIDVFAPAIGNAHGVYRAEPQLDAQRVSDIVAAEPVPIALHGGTGMTDAQFRDDLEHRPEVRQLFFLGGSEDFVLHVAVHDTDALRDFVVEQLSAHPAVASTRTSLVFQHHAN